MVLWVWHGPVQREIFTEYHISVTHIWVSLNCEILYSVDCAQIAVGTNIVLPLFPVKPSSFLESWISWFFFKRILLYDCCDAVCIALWIAVEAHVPLSTRSGLSEALQSYMRAFIIVNFCCNKTPTPSICVAKSPNRETSALVTFSSLFLVSEYTNSPNAMIPWKAKTELTINAYSYSCWLYVYGVQSPWLLCKISRLHNHRLKKISNNGSSHKLRLSLDKLALHLYTFKSFEPIALLLIVSQVR